MTHIVSCEGFFCLVCAKKLEQLDMVTLDDDGNDDDGNDDDDVLHVSLVHAFDGRNYY